MLLFVALLVNACTESFGRKLSADIGGVKRLNALSTFISTIILTPFALFTFLSQQVYKTKKNFLCCVFPYINKTCFFVQYNVTSWFNLFLLCELVVLLVFVADFYAEAICITRLDAATVARYCPILMFVTAFLFGYVWFEPYRTASPMDLLHGHGLQAVEHGFSGGLIFTLIFFILGKVAKSCGGQR